MDASDLLRLKQCRKQRLGKDSLHSWLAVAAVQGVHIQRQRDMGRIWNNPHRKHTSSPIRKPAFLRLEY